MSSALQKNILLLQHYHRTVGVAADVWAASTRKILCFAIQRLKTTQPCQSLIQRDGVGCVHHLCRHGAEPVKSGQLQEEKEHGAPASENQLKETRVNFAPQQVTCNTTKEQS
jgi:hypothetical protein